MTRRVYQGGNQSQGSGTGGAQTLTGDATGTLSGTNIATTVVALQGNAVAAGTPTTGGFLTWQGSSWASSTRLLYTDSTGALSWIASASPLITQAAPTSDVATSDFVITPQPPYASAVTNTGGGNARINLSAPAGSGTKEAALVMYRANSGLMSMGPVPNVPSQVGLWLGANSTARTQTNWFITGDGTDNYIGANSTLNLQLAGTTFVTVYPTILNIGYPQVAPGTGGGQGYIALSPAWVNPTSSPANGAVFLYVDKTGINYKCYDTKGTVCAITPASSGTTNTQARIIASQHATARISTSGNTTTLSVPLATSTTNCYFSATALIKIATAGSLNAVGDTFGSTIDGYVKNVAGALTIVGSTVSVATGSDTTLNTSAFAASVVSGTNIVLTLTATATAGTLGNADCTIYAEQVIN
jgi:hypothetical protein